MKLLAGFVLLWGSWLQPMHIFPWVSWHSELLAFVAVLAMVWEVAYSAGKRTSPRVVALPAATLPLLGLGAIWCLQWATGLMLFGGDALVLTAYLLLCAAAITVGFAHGRESFPTTLLLAGTLVAGALCSAIIAFAQTFEVWESFIWIHRSPYSTRPGANLGQPNQLATLLLMGLVGVTYLFECRKFGRTLSVTLAIVLLLALAATESRAGVLGLLVLSAWWWFAKRRSIVARSDSKFVAASVFGFLCTFWAWPILMAEFFQVGNSLSMPVNTVAYNRWIIWPQLLQAVSMRPWSGWGFGQVATALNTVVDAYPKSEIYTYAHNIVLDFALGIGVPVTGLLVILVSAWFWRRARSTTELGSWYCLAVVFPVAAHSMVEFPFAYAYFLVPVMFAVGTLEGLQGGKPFLQLPVKPFVAGMVFVSAAFAWSIPEYLKIEDDFRVVRFESLRLGKTPENYQRPHIYLFTQLDALLHGGRIVPRPNMPEAEVELARVAALHFPMIATQHKYALSLALNNQPREAVRQLRAMRAQQHPKTYQKIKEAWTAMANEKYPQLLELELP